MKSYQEIKEKLKIRREELVERINRVEKNLRHSESPLDDDFAEQAVERENDDVLEILLENMRNEVFQIDHAISLTEQGTYGVCEYCGKEINEKRMTALPYTNVCINCAT